LGNKGFPYKDITSQQNVAETSDLNSQSVASHGPGLALAYLKNHSKQNFAGRSFNLNNSPISKATTINILPYKSVFFSTDYASGENMGSFF
jgi:hypothetical protein